MRPFRVRVPITDFIEFLKVASGTNEIFTPLVGVTRVGAAVRVACGAQERAKRREEVGLSFGRTTPTDVGTHTLSPAVRPWVP